jgi:methionine synthase I (cobalamin-dependent)
VQRAVELARRGAGERALVAAALAPIGDCYAPDEVPDTDRLVDEHCELAEELMRAGVNLILVETMVSSLEAEAAAKAAASVGVPFLVSFVTGPEGRLLSGQRLSDVLPAVVAHQPWAVGVNCVSCRHADAALAQLIDFHEGVLGRGAPAGDGAGNAWPAADADRSLGGCAARSSIAISVYANTGERAEDGSWRVTTASEPAVYAGLADGWLERGVRLIGGCCGTTPQHVSALQGLISQRFGRS